MPLTQVWTVVSLPVGLRLDGGFGVFACGVGGAKKAFGRFGAFQAWQTAGLNAKKKLLMWLWCLFACGVGGAKKAFGAFGGWLWCLCLRGWEPSVGPWCLCLLKAKKKLLMGPWCLCLRGWGCQKGIWRVWSASGLANSRLERQEKAIDVPWCLFACGVGGAKKALGAFGRWLWCLCLRGWGCQKGIWRVWSL